MRWFASCTLPFAVATILLLAGLLARADRGRRALRSGRWDADTIAQSLLATDPLGISADPESLESYRVIARVLWEETDGQSLAMAESAADWIAATMKRCEPDTALIPRRLAKAGRALAQLYAVARSGPHA